MRVLSNKWTGVAIYVALVSGMCVLSASLASHVAKQAIALALPYLPDEGPRPLSLVERRQMDAAQASPPAMSADMTEVVLTALPTSK
jgi:hypothetical protein